MLDSIYTPATPYYRQPFRLLKNCYTRVVVEHSTLKLTFMEFQAKFFYTKLNQTTKETNLYESLRKFLVFSIGISFNVLACQGYPYTLLLDRGSIDLRGGREKETFITKTFRELRNEVSHTIPAPSSPNLFTVD